MSSTDLWYRRFKRSDEDDEDLLADAVFREANFKDFFGQWLQRDQNANVNSFDEIMMEFWSTPFCRGSVFPITRIGTNMPRSKRARRKTRRATRLPSFVLQMEVLSSGSQRTAAGLAKKFDLLHSSRVMTSLSKTGVISRGLYA